MQQIRIVIQRSWLIEIMKNVKKLIYYKSRYIIGPARDEHLERCCLTPKWKYCTKMMLFPMARFSETTFSKTVKNSIFIEFLTKISQNFPIICIFVQTINLRIVFKIFYEHRLKYCIFVILLWNYLKFSNFSHKFSKQPNNCVFRPNAQNF